MRARVLAWLRQPAPGWLILAIPVFWILIAAVMVIMNH